MVPTAFSGVESTEKTRREQQQSSCVAQKICQHEEQKRGQGSLRAQIRAKCRGQSLRCRTCRCNADSCE